MPQNYGMHIGETRGIVGVYAQSRNGCAFFILNLTSYYDNNQQAVLKPHEL